MNSRQVWLLVSVIAAVAGVGWAASIGSTVAYGAAPGNLANGIQTILGTLLGGGGIVSTIIAILKSGVLGNSVTRAVNTATHIEQGAEEAAMQLLIGSAGVRGDADIGGDLAMVSAKIKSKWWGGETVLPDISPSTLKDVLKLNLIDDHLLSVVKSIRDRIQPAPTDAKK